MARGDTLKFPSQRQDPTPAPALRPAVVMETIPLSEASELLKILSMRISQAQDLLSYVDRRRPDARRAGVETIAIELSAVLEGGRLERAYDALEEAIQKQKPANLTRESLDRIRRFELLITDAARNLGDVPLQELSGAVKRRIGLGDGQAPISTVPAALIWAPVAFFGVLVISISVVWLLSSSEKKK